jgi:hypothetical protein
MFDIDWVTAVKKAEEKVSLREHRWINLAFEDGIDAAATVEPEEVADIDKPFLGGSKGLVYFFRDDLLVPYRISKNNEGAVDQSHPIVTRYPHLPPKYQRHLDAVLYWPKNKRLYFFKEGSYLACEPKRGAPLQEERSLPGGWTNLPFEGIDAAFVGKRGGG